MSYELRKMASPAELTGDGSRVETGPVQFGDDWPGVFIRGDNALMGFLPALQVALSKLEPYPGPETLAEAMAAIEIKNLIELLESLNRLCSLPHFEHFRRFM